MIIVVLIVLGLCLGSFTNALVWRYHRQSEIKDNSTVSNANSDAELAGLSIATGRSMCVHCHHVLAAKDLVPVISYLTLRGRCRYCRKLIQDTPIPELLTPFLFVVSYLYWPYQLQGAGMFNFIMWLLFLVGFVALAQYDYRWYELPHDIVFPLVCLALLQHGITATVYGGGLDSLRQPLLGAVVGVGLFSLLYRLSPKQKETDKPNAITEQSVDVTSYKLGIGAVVLDRLLGWIVGNKTSLWIGGGDITLALLLGLLVGGPGNILLVIFVASLLGTLVALPMLIARRTSRSSQLPFGPLLLAAVVIVKLWGASLIAWYLSAFLA